MSNVSLFGPNGNGATGPGSSSGYSGPFTAGVAFKVTATGQYLLGYYLWRADSSQSSSASFGLWTITGTSTGTFVSGSSVSISGMSTGAWNFVSLSPALSLTSGTSYRAVYGEANNFPDTQHQFGTGGAYSAGITNGVLTAFSDIAGNGGSNPEPHAAVQETYSTAGSDPTANYPATPDISSNFWIDVLIGVPAAVTGPAYTAYMASM